MPQPTFVQIAPREIDGFGPLLGADDYARVAEVAVEAREFYAGRAIWHVSSTARGGGVSEILRGLLPYIRGVGVDTRWVIVRDPDGFFKLTKRIHNHLHGDPGDGGELGAPERLTYESALGANAAEICELVKPGDVVFLHDPQTAGLVAAMKETGAVVVWRCHIGVDEPNETVRAAQRFLEPYVRAADAWVFSRERYRWPGLDPERTWIMAPSMDPFSPKNQELAPKQVEAILGAIGLGPGPPSTAPVFSRVDGTPGRVDRVAETVQEVPIPKGAKLVTQVSRWDRLKDPRGVLDAFERHLAGERMHLLLAGPATVAIADDPEGTVVWAEVRAAWESLPGALRARVHLACLPMDDLEENGAMVNAVQRRSDVVVQKSLAEGFGLTVAEAMWKSRPVVGSRLGGIQDQIVDGVSGILVDPHDLEATARAIAMLCADPARAAELGEQARRRVRDHFLAATRLAEYAELLMKVGELAA